ncbi:hypothetical protein [Nostoc phage Nsp-JY21]
MAYTLPVSGTGPNQSVSVADHEDAINAALEVAKAEALSIVLDDAPATLDTLKALASAIDNDPDFSATMADALAGKAPLESAPMTGVPTAPTAEPGTSTTQLATTAFVIGEVDAAATDVRRLYDTSVHRAELVQAFTLGLTGLDPAAMSAGASAVHDDLGAVWLLDGADAVGGFQLIAPREAVAVEAGRIYSARFVFARVADPADPLGHGIEIRMQNLNKSRASVSNVLVQSVAATAVADGVQDITITFSRSAGQDYQNPSSTRYVRPYLQLYGGDHATAVAVIEISDITDIAAEATARAAALAAEAAAREAADGGLAGDIAAEATARAAALAAEAAAREAADGGLAGDIAAEATARAAALAAEAAVREAADGGLAGDIAAEATARAAALAAEAAAREAADDGLAGDIAAEATARAAADAALSAGIAAEATARQAAVAAEAALRAAHEARTDNPHSLTKAQIDLAPIGLGRDDVGAFEGGVVDVNDRGVGFDEDGQVHSGGVVIYREDLSADRDAVSEIVPFLASQDGKTMIGIRPDGIDIAMSQDMLDRIGGGGGGGYTDPAIFLGLGRRAFSVRAGDDYTYATTQLPDGYVSDIVQVVDRETAIPVSALPLRHVAVTGQSNAGAGPGPVGQPPVAGTLVKDFVLRANADDYASGSTLRLPGGANDFVSASEPRLANQAQAPMAMIGYAMHMLDRRAGREIPGAIISTAWQGGQTIDKFFPGVFPSAPGSESPLYENLYAQIANAALVAAAPYSRSVEHNIFYIQGEGDTNYASYLAQMTDYIEDVLPTFAAVASGGATPHFFLYQTQTGTAASIAAMGSGNAQLQVARDFLGAGVTLIGPMYQGPVHDNIHHNNPARMMMGEIAALAYEWVRIKGQVFNPLWQVAGGVTRSGAVITIPLQLPPGTSALSFDTDWVADIVDKGLWYSDDSGSPPAISTVTISGTNIVVTLAANPGSATGKSIGYGTKKTTETAGWASSRGLVYADTGIPSPYHGLGYAVPPTIRHYLCRFTETFA